jgi:hypothetical protein
MSPGTSAAQLLTIYPGWYRNYSKPCGVRSGMGVAAEREHRIGGTVR